MADNKHKDETTVLGDIDPIKHSSNAAGAPFHDTANVTANDEEFDPLAGRGNEPSGSRRAGSRDVTEGPNVSGTRNMHSTGGAAGSDLGNRPE